MSAYMLSRQIRDIKPQFVTTTDVIEENMLVVTLVLVLIGIVSGNITGTRPTSGTCLCVQGTHVNAHTSGMYIHIFNLEWNQRLPRLHPSNVDFFVENVDLISHFTCLFVFCFENVRFVVFEYNSVGVYFTVGKNMYICESNVLTNSRYIHVKALSRIKIQ